MEVKKIVILKLHSKLKHIFLLMGVLPNHINFVVFLFRSFILLHLEDDEALMATKYDPHLDIYAIYAQCS